MKSATLAALTKICSRISNGSSLTSLYRSIELEGDTIRCCSEFGNLEIVSDDTGLTTPCLVDTSALLAIAQSLPVDSDITLTEKAGKLEWKCGSAKGTLSIVATDHKIPKITHKTFPWTPQETLADALLLASCACQAQAVSVGLYGIVIEPNGNDLHLLSSNSISLASATIEKGTYPTGKITIRPPIPAVIAALISSCPNCALDITTSGIFIRGDWLLAHLPLGANLSHDLKKVADGYASATNVAKVNSSAVKKFITRARVLSDKHISFTVGLKVEGGKLILQHSGISSQTEEIFLADGLDTALKFDSVDFPADMLLLPIEMVQSVVFDYLDKSQLVLKGENPQFLYVLGGGSE